MMPKEKTLQIVNRSLQSLKILDFIDSKFIRNNLTKNIVTRKKIMIDNGDPYFYEIKEFQGSERMKSLYEKFWNMESLKGFGIVPRWDTSIDAKFYNSDILDEDLEKLQLHMVDMQALLQHIDVPSAYKFRGIYNEILLEGTHDKFLRVIAKWQDEIALPPPVLATLDNLKISKCDGYHRLAVCSLVGVDKLPCWILNAKFIERITIK